MRDAMPYGKTGMLQKTKGRYLRRIPAAVGELFAHFFEMAAGVAFSAVRRTQRILLREHVRTAHSADCRHVHAHSE
ncbi:protein of unknown function [Burkholderia multivorans]